MYSSSRFMDLIIVVKVFLVGISSYFGENLIPLLSSQKQALARVPIKVAFIV
jgi:hypothetical protein